MSERLKAREETCQDGESKDKLLQDYQEATVDYRNCALYKQYAHFAESRFSEVISGTESPERQEAIDRVRQIYEQAILYCGLFVDAATSLWNQYRQFEMNLMTHILQQANTNPESLAQQIEKIQTLFCRQLAIPLVDMDKTLEAYVEWRKSIAPEETEGEAPQGYNEALQALAKKLSFEEAVVEEEGSKDAWLRYLKFEQSPKGGASAPALFALYERMIAKHYRDPDVWLRYLDCLSAASPDRVDLMVEMHQRALRCRPDCATLWVSYMHCLERHSASPDEDLEAALSTAMQNVTIPKKGRLEDTDVFLVGSDAGDVMLAYCNSKRRRLDRAIREAMQQRVDNAVLDEVSSGKLKKKPHNRVIEQRVQAAMAEHIPEDEAAKPVRQAFDHCVKYATQYYKNSDPAGRIHRAYSSFEAYRMRNMPNARTLYDKALMAYGRDCLEVWLDAITMERTVGELRRAHALCKRAVTFSAETANVEALGRVWVELERARGSLQELDAARLFVRQRLDTIRTKKHQARERELSRERRPRATRHDHEHDHDHDHAILTLTLAHEAETPAPEETDSTMHMEVERQPNEETTTTTTSTSTEQEQVMAPPPMRPPRKHMMSMASSSASSSDQGEMETQQACKRSRTDEGEDDDEEAPHMGKKREWAPPAQQLQPTWGRRDENTLFVRGVAKEAGEEDLRALFPEVKSVRMCIKPNGRHKGFGYLEFHDEESMRAAMQQGQGKELHGQAINLAISNPPKRDREELHGHHREDPSFQQRSRGGGRGAFRGGHSHYHGGHGGQSGGHGHPREGNAPGTGHGVHQRPRLGWSAADAESAQSTAGHTMMMRMRPRAAVLKKTK